MQIYDTIRKTEYGTVVALGFFDGVHKGHSKVIRTCIDNTLGELRSVVFTFTKSPASVVTKEEKPLLTTNEQKFALLKEQGADIVFCVDFASVMNLSAEQFVRDILMDKLNAKCVVTGFNYHFGKGGKACADDLVKLCDKYGIKAIKCDPVMYEGQSISSTRIRQCIKHGELEKANDMLGYSFTVDTVVTSGNHIGTKISTPTINQKLHNSVVVPKFGVYATKVTVDNNEYIGATNIGTHPTVGECEPVCETHLLDLESGDLYDRQLSTKLLKFIRPERKFESITELKQQIEKDKAQINEYFKK